MNLDLIKACRTGSVERVNNLLEAGVDPNQADDEGRTPLHWTALSDNLEIVQLLLKAGADPNKSNRWKNTPLCYAAQKGNLETVKLLLKAGANPNQANIDNFTPLYWAARKGHLEIVELLKSYENKISSLSLLCLRTIYRNQINTDNIPGMILEWNFHVNTI